MEFMLRRMLMVNALLAVLMATGFEAARATRRARVFRQWAVVNAAFRALSLVEAAEYRYAYVHRTAAGVEPSSGGMCLRAASMVANLAVQTRRRT